MLTGSRRVPDKALARWHKLLAVFSIVNCQVTSLRRSSTQISGGLRPETEVRFKDADGLDFRVEPSSQLEALEIHGVDLRDVGPA